MGFTVLEELNFPKFGVNASGCYVTIKGSYSITKLGSGAPVMYMMSTPNNDTPYTLSARWFVCASNGAGLQPLREEVITVSFAQPPANCYNALYVAIKEQYFTGKTFSDLL